MNTALHFSRPTEVKMTKIPKNIDRVKIQDALEDKVITDTLNTIGEMEWANF